MFGKGHYFLQCAAQPPVPPCKKGRRGLDGGWGRWRRRRRRTGEAVLFPGQTQWCLGLRMSPFQDNDLPESCHRLKASIKHHTLPFCLSMSTLCLFLFTLSGFLPLSVVNSTNLNIHSFIFYWQNRRNTDQELIISNQKHNTHFIIWILIKNVLRIRTTNESTGHLCASRLTSQHANNREHAKYATWCLTTSYKHQLMVQSWRDKRDAVKNKNIQHGHNKLSNVLM